MRITVGHTPDSDDAFMFYAMLTKKIVPSGFEIEHVIEDIESLNRAASSERLDVTAVSVHACAHLEGRTILQSGGSFGLGYGPIVTAAQEISVDDLSQMRIAIPGKMTSAFLLLQLMIGKFEYVEMRFDDIPEAVRDGRVDAGLVIHETQLSYPEEGNIKIADVGEWWHETTGGLPVPLGVNVINTSLGDSVTGSFDACLRDSIVYARNNVPEAMDYAMQYSRGKPRDLIERFVKMYVNERTVRMGDAGKESIERLLGMARERGLVPEYDVRISP